MALIALQAAVSVVVAVLALAVVRSRGPEQQLIPFTLYGVVLALLFVVLQAPDVAVSAIVVGGVYPFIILLTLARTRGRPP
ncbi:MAG TPA: hydrogenase subunit MbhD domain-containing protein [Actinomycetota bacterium]|nr:hydrogenase subunit MbhD domain-containing protein [Actinomycetota bacterium]